MGKLGEDDCSSLPQEHTWLGGVQIGEGGFGTIHCWLKVDQNQNVIDRMVIKDPHCSDDTKEPPAYRGIYEELVRKGMDFGINPDRPGHATIDERFFREAYLQGLMTDNSRPFSAATVSLRGFKKGHLDNITSKLDGSQKLKTHWRIYMDLLHAGDLKNLIERHIAGKNGRKDPIPEPYIWCVFTCIAEALVQLESAVQARPNARQQQDEVIALMDMKPPNILLQDKRGDRYPVYPKPLLSDLGAAHVLYKEDPLQNRDVRGHYFHGATSGFFAPEMWKDTNYGWERGIDKPVYSWTNIWQAGRTIECMMRLRVKLDHEKYSLVCDDNSRIKEDPPRIEGFPEFRYSDDLIDLVWRCQRFEPEQRPTPTQLLELIRSRAPKHNRGMDEWGNATWIEKREAASSQPKTYSEVLVSSASSNLDFLDGYPPDLAKRYRQLNVSLPMGWDLAFYGYKDPARLNTRARIPPRKPEDPYAGVKW
ncbi:hypothetical protein QM012_005348 [Aureobasidium pullulans]|uniref:Protein kinase domain-containing protein n=1 Tax=Aureobasidium pullulans TaxID=5580 RepID=A0ABR0T619_AURPU